MPGFGKSTTLGLATSCVLAVCVVGHGCDDAGTDTGNPVAHVSECKKFADEGPSPQALTRAETDPATYEGLHCMRWEREGEQVRFDVFNLIGPCYVVWEGKSRARKDGGLDLVLRNARCQHSGCIDDCLYDATFEVEASKLGADDAEVGLLLDDCGDEVPKVGAWTLHAGKNASELVCEYADAVGVGAYASNKGKCGKANMPCMNASGSCGGLGYDAGLNSDPDAGSEADACDPGLTCVDVGGHDRRCLTDCKKDADCPLPDVMACDDGVCRLPVK